MRRPESTLGKFVFFITGTLVVLAAILFLGTLIAGIWLPDNLGPPRWIHVDTAALPNGQELRLYQKRDGVFYSTFIVCRGGSEPDCIYLAGIDDCKSWHWDVTLHAGQNLAKIAVGPRVVYTYDWAKRELRSSQRPKPYGAWSLDEFKAKFGTLPTP